MRRILPLLLLTLTVPLCAAERLKAARGGNSKALGREIEIATFKAEELKLTPDQLELFRKARTALDAYRRQVLESPDIKSLLEKLKTGNLTKEDSRALRSELAEKLEAKAKELPAGADVKSILTPEQFAAFERLREDAEKELRAKKKSKYVESVPIPEATLEF